jgi:AraC-like DNA-binding protein
MKNTPSSSNIIINLLTESSRKMSLPIDDLLKQLPSNSQVSANEKARMPIEVLPIIWQWFSDQSKGSNIGLHLAKRTPLTSQTMLTYIIMTCKSLEEVLEAVVKLQWFICDGDIVKVNKNPEQCHIEFQFSRCSEQVFRHQSDYALLLFHNWLQDLLGEVWQLKKVQIVHPQPRDPEEYRDLFSCDIEFLAESNALIFDTKLLDTQIRYANEQLNTLLQGQVLDLELHIAQGKVVVEVAALIQEHLSTGTVSLEEIAKQCQLSDRQLKRLLELQETSFSELIEQERKILAQRLLADEKVTIAEVSDACGFAEPSIFNRAFKRWFACTPSQYRKKTKLVEVS